MRGWRGRETIPSNYKGELFIMRRGGFSSGERSSGAAEEALGGGAHLLIRQGLAVFGFTLHPDLREVSCYAEAMPDVWGANSYSSHKSESFPSLVMRDVLVSMMQ